MVKILLAAFILLLIVCIALKLKRKKRGFLPRRKYQRTFSGEVKRFYYALLSSQQQDLYDILVMKIAQYASEIDLSGMNFKVSDFDGLWEAILYDHPEFFWIESFRLSSIEKTKELKAIHVKSRYGKYEIKTRKSRIEGAAGWILGQIKPGMDDYEKALLIHDSIIDLTSYVSFGTNNQNIDSVLIDHHSVCAGYSKTYQYLLTLAGIEATTVRGYVDSERHAWNLIRLDGEYYYTDVTWDDPTFTRFNWRHEGNLSHAYFAVTAEEMLQSRTLAYGKRSYPACTATADNYFVREKRFYSSAESFIIGAKEAFADGKKSFEGKFKDRQSLEQAAGSLSRSFGAGLTYSYNREMRTLTVTRK